MRILAGILILFAGIVAFSGNLLYYTEPWFRAAIGFCSGVSIAHGILTIKG